MLVQNLAVLLCLTVHETCHGLAAYLLGDPTAKRMHRLSFNPLRHIDVFGALMMLVAGFGWAKPVPVDMRYFKHPKSGMALTALAGPVSNFVLAYLALCLRALLIVVAYQVGADSVLLIWGIDFLATVAILSVGLGLFNLFPFRPWTARRCWGPCCRTGSTSTILRYERIGMLLLVVDPVERGAGRRTAVGPRRGAGPGWPGRPARPSACCLVRGRTAWTAPFTTWRGWSSPARRSGRTLPAPWT